MLKVISIDPGETTGWAEGKIEDGYMQVRAGQEVLGHLELYDWLTQRYMDVIVCESFDFRKRAQGVNMYPRELIGVINLFVQMQQTQFYEHKVKLYMQKPAEGKSYFTDAKLKEANLYHIGQEHARDATRHILQWYEFGAGYKYNKKGFGPWNSIT